MNEYVVTREGYNKMVERYKYLTTEKRDEIAEKLTIARGFGDLSENAEYDAARSEQAKVESEILDLEVKIRKANIIDSDNLDLSKVNIGCTVKLYDEEFDEEIEYKIVGSSESDPANNNISCASPVGKALIGAKKGQTVVVETPNGEIKLKVLALLNK